MERSRKYFSFILLLLLGSLILPKEFVHEFFHQEETCDVLCQPTDGPTLSPEHQHCDLLQLSSPPLYLSNFVFYFQLQFLEGFTPVYAVSGYTHQHSGQFFLRGPPGSCS